MEDAFILDVEHNGKTVQLETRFLRLGYTYKFTVLIEDLEVVFERDEEGGFRAVMPEGADEKSKRNVDVSLLHAISNTLKKALQ